MANSKYEYVRTFEQPATLLPNTYIVVRIDGRGFHKLSGRYGFQKPNDRRALDLMNAAAIAVLKELPEICCAYGTSDEFSFVFDRSTEYERLVTASFPSSKILTTVVSTFTSYYVHLWSTFFPETSLTQPMPSFDGRVVLYPSWRNLRDYLSWRQVDCHINNLYNTTFWTLVQRGGFDTTKAAEKLQGTSASDKNEILFSQFQMNYNNEPEMFKKGSMVYRDHTPFDSGEGSLAADPNDPDVELSKTQNGKVRKRRMKASITIEHTDIIMDSFWEQRPWLITR